METESIYECIGRIEYVANHPEAYGGPKKALARIRALLSEADRASAAMECLGVTISGSADEIAALVLAVQGRREREIKLELDGHRLSEQVKKGLNLPDLSGTPT